MTKQEQIEKYRAAKEAYVREGKWKSADICETRIKLLSLPIEKEVGQ